MSDSGHIVLRGVRVHNLQSIDLDLPRRKLIVFCGLSGSGKSSLALDTLYAEGQRRYIESFSAYTRQFLERLERPGADRIEGIPPAMAVSGANTSRSSRSTVGTATEINDYLRLLMAKIGRVFCMKCGREVRRDSPQSMAETLATLPEGTRLLVAFPYKPADGETLQQAIANLREDGFVRAIIDGQTVGLDTNIQPQRLSLTEKEDPPYKPGTFDRKETSPFRESTSAGEPSPNVILGRFNKEVKSENHSRYTRDDTMGAVASRPSPLPPLPSPLLHAIVDRLVAGRAGESRLRDSLETAFAKGHGRCCAFVETGGDHSTSSSPLTKPLCGKTGATAGLSSSAGDFSRINTAGQASSGTQFQQTAREQPQGVLEMIDSKPWRRINFSTHLACDDCGIEYPTPEPRLYSFNSPLGACPECEGFGNIVDLDMELIVPDPGRSLRGGAIAPWNTPAYAPELKKLLSAAKKLDLPVDVPFSELTGPQRELILHGSPEHDFGGLKGFFALLERRKYKMHVRVYLSRWRSFRPCPSCDGARLRPEALAARVGGKNLGEICRMKVRDAAAMFRDIELSDYERQVGRMMLDQVRARLGYLEAVGLGYLTLDRTLRTLSGGEARRVSLTSALGSSLVNMLYVLDEPSIGLHPHDIRQLLDVVKQLRDRGNTVVVVEHEEAIIRAADQVVEIGPGAGQRGGKVVFQGTPGEMQKSTDSLTGDYLSGRRGFGSNGRRRQPNHGWVRLAGARGNNLDNVTVEFPLGVLCLVTGVSGSGKSTLVQDTLYPALCRRLRKDAPKPYPFDDVFGDGQLDDVIMIDQSPIGRSPRSNPVTYLKAFDEIRAVFAETVEARTRGYDAGAFSFNVEGGRCSVCKGDGFVRVDMQFLADVYMRCSQCNGTRYRDEILDVTYRGRNIADVLNMTVREAFTFFRGRPKVQARLKRLIDVGLDYVRLGQPANTLSGGEAQRLKLAAYTSGSKRGRCLFILDEPTTGLHYADVVQLLDCFDTLLSVGHSLLVVEHNLQIMKAADYIVDLGPGAADEGGRVVAKGTPEMVARVSESATAGFLAKMLK